VPTAVLIGVILIVAGVATIAWRHHRPAGPGVATVTPAG